MSRILFVTLWNKVYTESDHFLGFVRLPMASFNLQEGGFSRWYPLDIIGIFTLFIA